MKKARSVKKTAKKKSARGSKPSNRRQAITLHASYISSWKGRALVRQIAGEMDRRTLREAA
jgi:hypothetical protein